MHCPVLVNVHIGSHQPHQIPLETQPPCSNALGVKYESRGELIVQGGLVNTERKCIMKKVG